MRRAAGAICAAAGLLLLPVGAASSAQERRYARIDVSALFFYQVDRGDTGGIMGHYTWRGVYRMHTIAVFDGNRVTTPGGLTTIAGGTVVIDERKKRVLVDGNWKIVPYCAGWGDTGPSSRENFQDYKAAPRASASIGGDARLRISASGSVSWKRGCSESETLNTHNLPAGPNFAVPAPAKSRFRGRQSFSIRCYDDETHGPKHGVQAFQGMVNLGVTITPFPASELQDQKAGVRDLIGKKFPEPQIQGASFGKACL